MKNLRIAVVFFMLIGLVACQDDPVVNNDSHPSEPARELSLKQEGQEQGRRQRYCLPKTVKGLLVTNPVTGLSECKPSLSGICSIKWYCYDIPEIFFDPCEFIPCWIEPFEPWEIYFELQPEEFFSFKDELGIDIDLDTEFAPARINEVNLVLQFYAPKEEVLNKEVLFLANDLNLGEEFAELYGMNGSTIAAGEYPVIFNPENNTYNAIVNVGW
ncbi:MAG: hypothetical protein MJA30_14350 [Cytophagales bacterium]|nr:hypothetical protein [Cytophagales bacterium]